MTERTWEHFPFAADFGLRGFGSTRAMALEAVALALTGAITDPVSVRAREKVAIWCVAPDDEILLYDWLNTIIFEMATRDAVTTFNGLLAELERPPVRRIVAALHLTC